MAKLSQNTSINAVDGAAAASRRAIFNFGFAEEDHDANYLHFKTNCAKQNGAMIMVEAIGFNYGTAQPIRCAWTWYAYNDPQAPIQGVGLQNIYSGMVPDRVYISGDGYFCFSTTKKELYYLGVTFDCYNTAPNGTGFDLQITQVGRLATAGNFF